MQMLVFSVAQDEESSKAILKQYLVFVCWFVLFFFCFVFGGFVFFCFVLFLEETHWK